MASNVQLSTETHFPLQENGYAHKCFPVRNIRRFKPDNGGAWLVEYKAEKARQMEALTQNSETSKKRRAKTKKAEMLTVDYLIKAFHLDEANGLYSVDVSARQLESDSSEDFSAFTNVLYVEGGDNNLSFETFKSFPKLEELHLQVNHISDIKISHNHFLALKRLDLSYNPLKENALLELGKLRNLKELTLRGCSLKSLHAELARAYVVSAVDDDDTKTNAQKKTRYVELEHLDLSENRLTDLSTFASLAGLRKLKSLNLSMNKICGVPHLKLLVSHRHFSATTSCQCDTTSKNTLVVDPVSTDNVDKSNQFRGLNNSPTVVPSIEVCEDIAVDLREGSVAMETNMQTAVVMETSSIEATIAPVTSNQQTVATDVSDSHGTPIAKIPGEAVDEAHEKNSGDVLDQNDGFVKEVDAVGDVDGLDGGINVDFSIDMADDITLNNLSLDVDQEMSMVKSLELDVDEDKILDVDVEEAIENALHEETVKENVLNDLDNEFKVNAVPLENIPQQDIQLPDVVLTTTEVNFTLGETLDDRGVQYDENNSPLKNDDVTPTDDVIDSLKNPFPSLKSLDLSKNLIAEEEALLALTAWPALQDLKLWMNPLLQSKKQLPDVISHHLTRMCGINVVSKPPESPPSHPIAPSISKTARTYRVKNRIPPIKRNNVHMIEHQIQKAIEDKERVEELTHPDEDEAEITKNASEEIAENDNNTEKPVEDDAEGIFMTQVDETAVAEEEEQDRAEDTPPEHQGPDLNSILLDPKYAGYEELLRIDETYETEDEILIPSTVNGSVQALRHMLKNPLVFKEGSYNRKSRLVDDPTKALKKKKGSPPQKEKQVDQVSTALELIRTKNTTSEENLATVLEDFNSKSTMKERFPEAKKIMKRVQEKYDKVRSESLRPVSVNEQQLSRLSTRADKNSQDLILMRMKHGKIGDLYSSPRSTAFPRSRNSQRKSAPS